LRSNLIRLLTPIGTAAALAGAVPGAGSEPFATVLKPFLATQCVACHNATLKQGELDLDALAAPGEVARDPAAWEKVVLKLKTGEMPPPPYPKPDGTELHSVLRFLEAEIERAWEAAPPQPGRVTARRLNRTEYDNTVRDLLGVDFGASDDFPPDDSGYGFDNIGDVLSISPALMERYMATAEKVARAALFGVHDMQATATRHQPIGRKIRNQAAPLHEYDLTGLSLPNAVHVTRRFPAEGEYAVRVTLGGQRPAGSESIRFSLWLDGEKVETQELDPEKQASFSGDRQDLAGMTREFRLRVSAGEHWLAAAIDRLYEGLPPDYVGPNPSTRTPPPPPQFKPPPNATPERVEELRKAFEARLKEHIPANNARVSLMVIAGPYAVRQGPSRESLEKVYACGHLGGRHLSGCARRIVSTLARRAFRRPVTEAEVSRFTRLFTSGRKDGGSFEHGLALALQAILVSPDFLFRLEGTASRHLAAQTPAAAAGGGGVSARALSPHELASRLSYFLWSSMPDEELSRVADRSELVQGPVLASQVRRMLKDEKAASLVRSFGGQWLQFRALESARVDTERFPDFEDYLRLSMRRETELFLESIVREDRSILDLLDARYTFLNERLARHYGIEGVSGPAFRRVELGGTPRAGVLGHASVLTVSSYPTRTSPVLRGKWILENLLNAPPPEPPAGTPRLDESALGKAASLRQQLEAHRSDATCAACHSRMDPLGFGLENYDAVGAWRERDGGSAIDASGSLPDGRSFKGPAELAAILKADREEFARGFTAKLLTYALGRGLERYDRPTVKAIAARAAAGEYRFSSVVLEIVKSLPFQRRWPERAAS
jgi:mono/diheme cytochrome c family protein